MENCFNAGSKIERETIKVIRDILGDENKTILFQSDSKLINDIGLDSLLIVEMIMSLEEKFDIEIDEEDFGYTVTFEDLIQLIKSKF